MFTDLSSDSLETHLVMTALVTFGVREVPVYSGEAAQYDIAALTEQLAKEQAAGTSSAESSQRLRDMLLEERAARASSEAESQQLRTELNEERAAQAEFEEASQQIRMDLEEERAARADVDAASQQLCLELERVQLDAGASILETKVCCRTLAPNVGPIRFALDAACLD